ncbi:MAG: hypothetical protein KJO63_02130 [Maribacter sp.]|nr:hypothetical protein [Maribacter sp.]
MNLTTEQIQQIETYLDFKELNQLDLRNEVLDHMAAGVEKSLQDDGLTFKDAFDKEVKKWNDELSEHSNWLIGWAWTGPRILINKGVKKTKQFYIKSMLVAMTIGTIMYLMNKTLIEKGFAEIVNGFVGLLYFAIFFLICILYWRIKATEYQTAYSFLFKINAIGFAFMYLAFNPLFSDGNLVYNKEEVFAELLFFHFFLISFAYTFWDLYKSHIDSKKLVLN